MYKGTTPTLIFKLNTELELSTISVLWLTIKSMSTVVEKELTDVIINDEEKTISVELTQADTLSLPSGTAKVQIRFLTTDDKAFVTPIKELAVNQILKGGIIE